ncbi:MAG: TcfC E-set like domain-containing protein [Gammaproteobacteria bacterium]
MRSTRPTKALIMTALLLLSAAGWSQESFVQSASTPPPGFEDLAEPQMTLVDLYLGGRFKVATMARYDLTTIELLNPADVVTALSNLVDPQTVRNALSGPLPRNDQYLCANPAQTDCATLQPDVAGVTFDDSAFRVDLYLNPAQLAQQRLDTQRYLPAPTAHELSSVHQFNVALAGGGEQDGAFDLGATSLVAKGEHRLRSRYDISATGFSFSELSWQRDHAGYRYEAGLFRSLGRHAAFIGEQDVVGVRAGTALDLRADLDSAQGTPMFLFLTQRSRVDVFRGDRLLYSRFYEAGNQQLDTSRLPDGAYDLRVRVRGDDGREREERYFFVRTGQLPPLDEHLAYFEAGALTRFADRSAATLEQGIWLRSGLAKRFTNETGVDLEVLHAGRTTTLQGGLFRFGSKWQMRTGLLLNLSGDRGLWLQGSWQGERWTAGLDLRHIGVGDGLRQEGRDLFTESVTQSTFTLNAPVGTGRLTLRAQLDERGDGERSSGFGVSLAHPLYHRPGLTLDLAADLASARDDRLVQIGVQARFRRDRRLTTVRPQVQYSAGTEQQQTRALLDARTTSQWQHDTLGQLTHTAFAARDPQRTVLGTSMTTDSTRGRANGSIQYASGDDGAQLSYSANARFGVTTQADGVALGGRHSETAALVIDIDELSDEARFSVVIDDQTVALASAGRRTLVALQPYRSYDVRLVAHGDTYANIDQSTQDVTLYPGNVHTLRFAPRTVHVIVGQAVWPDGTPVANARIDNVDGFAGTDDHGWFQVEVESLTPLRLVQEGRKTCEVSLAEAVADGGLTVLPATLCQITPASP